MIYKIDKIITCYRIYRDYKYYNVRLIMNVHYVGRYNVMLCDVMSCNVMLCNDMSYDVMLCNVM